MYCKKLPVLVSLSIMPANKFNSIACNDAVCPNSISLPLILVT